eukprot:10218812-Heterocapsa_arctica.AAC.1
MGCALVQTDPEGLGEVASHTGTLMHDEQAAPRGKLECLVLAAEKGVGAEILGPREGPRMPRVGRQELTDILNMTGQEAMWLWQDLQ